MLSRFFEVRSPFFVPLWRRILVVGLVLGWAGIELQRGETLWALLFGAAGLWCAIQFFWFFDRAGAGGGAEDGG